MHLFPLQYFRIWNKGTFKISLNQHLISNSGASVRFSILDCEVIRPVTMGRLFNWREKDAKVHFTADLGLTCFVRSKILNSANLMLTLAPLTSEIYLESFRAVKLIFFITPTLWEMQLANFQRCLNGPHTCQSKTFSAYWLRSTGQVMPFGHFEK